MNAQGNVPNRGEALLEAARRENDATYCEVVSLSAGFAGRHVEGFGDLSPDIFLEVQNERYSQILYLIDYVVPGLHFW